jgi:hypothetical protein
MRVRPDCHLSRRTFLKLSGVAAAAGCLPGPGRLPAIVSTLPLPYAHTYISDPDTLLAAPAWPAGDLWLVPAYVAAALIRQGALRELAQERFRVLGRAHDPEGAFTVPHTRAAGVLLARGPAPRSLAEAWQANSLWPDVARFTLGAALMRHGYSPNDTHTGHLAQIEKDLLAARPHLAARPGSAVRQSAAAAFALVPRSAVAELGLQAAWPAEGTLVVDYDWVIPRHALRPGTALAFLRQAAASGASPAVEPPPGRWVPLTPLSAEAQVQRAELWARLVTRPSR